MKAKKAVFPQWIGSVQLTKKTKSCPRCLIPGLTAQMPMYMLGGSCFQEQKKAKKPEQKTP
jgi:hypothetical protein